MSEKTKKTIDWIYKHSRFWVLLYAFVVAIFLAVQFTFGVVYDSGIDLPINVLSYCWTFLISFYCGFDRFVDIRNTTALPIGQVALGDLPKLRRMIILSLFLLDEATTFYCVGHFRYGVEKQFALEAFASGFGATVIAYCVGNKIVKSQKFKCDIKDENGDNIPDDAENDFYKWKRGKVKEGTENQFITWDYFLDENPEWEKKYR